MISISQLEKAYSYTAYRQHIDELMNENKTTGNDQSEAMINYAKMNIQRMQRLEKTTVINEELASAISALKRKVYFVILTEGWCGDAAQNVPVFSFMEKLSDKISLKLLLRDENLDLMDQYLTNGGRSIPKLICIDQESLQELFVWGPRPQPCQNLMLELKARHADQKEKGEQIHLWYAKDKTQTLQQEIANLLRTV